MSSKLEEFVKKNPPKTRRSVFLKYMEEITALLRQGYSKRQIYEYLRDYEGVSATPEAFYIFLKNQRLKSNIYAKKLDEVEKEKERQRLKYMQQKEQQLNEEIERATKEREARALTEEELKELVKRKGMLSLGKDKYTVVNARVIDDFLLNVPNSIGKTTILRDIYEEAKAMDQIEEFMEYFEACVDWVRLYRKGKISKYPPFHRFLLGEKAE